MCLLLKALAVFPGVRLLEHFVDLFEGQTFGFHHEEVDNDNLEGIPDKEDQIN